MKKFLLPIFLVLPRLFFAQTDGASEGDDSFFLEDQIYIGINYNLLSDKPSGIFQRNFSYGLHGGVIRDIPLNKNGRVALGIGLGYAVNSYYSNLIVTEKNNTNIYEIAADGFDYNRSKLQTHSIEIPIEFRWRNATRNRYKFFRIYSGVQFDYNFSNRSKLVTDLGNTNFSNSDIEKFQYGLTLNVGYNTFNLHLYYALSDFMNKNILLTNGENLTIRPLKIGLIFYLL